MLQIKDKIISSPVIVAPMAGISNDAFRQLCYEFGAGLVYTEMVSDKAIYYENKKTLEMLKVSKESHPVSMQLFGSDIQTMVHAAKVLDKHTDCDIIDINMGCPVNKVVKTGAGSALMKHEDEAAVIVKQIVGNVNKPVTVKMRLGWDREHMNYLSLAKKLEEAGASAIALHARTRSQMYEGHSDWSHIRILKENLRIPVIGNGDVTSAEDFFRMQKETGCDAVMIGRGLIGNPFLIKEISDLLEGKERKEITVEEKLFCCLAHARKLIRLKGEKLAIGEMRGIAPHYLSGMYHASVYKAKMNQIRSYEELEQILQEYKKFLAER
ncbi:MAG: tRNA dihydrouridine synthase DusB [Erysipelotrichaceae bacterium]|nr:tRNA dihydrouridine synthase DusB [Erysipelotrichaceae bacterium]